MQTTHLYMVNSSKLASCVCTLQTVVVGIVATWHCCTLALAHIGIVAHWQCCTLEDARVGHLPYMINGVAIPASIDHPHYFFFSLQMEGPLPESLLLIK